MSRPLSDIGEFGLIERIRKCAPAQTDVVCGIGDDAAVLKFNSKEYLLFTTDMIVEDVHFLRRDGGKRIGHKALACNISDIAAMGGVPTAAVISLGAPPALELKFIDDIYTGINFLARRFGVAIVGGDTVKSSKLVVNIALLGRVAKRNLVTRSGAKNGDVIFVTGPLGRSFPSQRHLSFTPRVAEAKFLTSHFKLTAMIDISDGLAADLGHILKESQVGAELQENLIPRTAGASLKNALHDGEDFELLFTLSPNDARRLKSLKTKFHFYEIGCIQPKTAGMRLNTTNGKSVAIAPKGFRHF